MSNLAVITARGGSKRIPRKNIKLFLGKPIIAYSIEIALASGLFDEVMVSTDDKEIADIALKSGARVPFFRSQKTSDDFATTVDVLKEVYHDYQVKLNKSFDFVCCIYPTAPLIDSSHLIEGFDKLVDQGLKSVFPVVEFSYPVWRGLTVDDSGNTSMVWPEYLNSRSQDLTKVFHDAGQWYWYRPNEIQDTLFTDCTGSVILSESEVQDIDTAEDWKIAEIKYKIKNYGTEGN